MELFGPENPVEHTRMRLFEALSYVRCCTQQKILSATQCQPGLWSRFGSRTQFYKLLQGIYNVLVPAPARTPTFFALAPKWCGRLIAENVLVSLSLPCYQILFLHEDDHARYYSPEIGRFSHITHQSCKSGRTFRVGLELKFVKKFRFEFWPAYKTLL